MTHSIARRRLLLLASLLWRESDEKKRNYGIDGREGNWRENCDEIKSRAHYNDGRKSEHCHIIFCHRERVRASFLNAGCNLFHYHHVFRARDVTMMSDEMRSSVRNILIIMMGRKMNGFIEEFTAIIFLSIDRHEIPHISKS